MATIRFAALQKLADREPVKIDRPKEKMSEYFGKYVFDHKNMQKYLTKDVYESIVSAIKNNDSINRKIADQVATGMKNWAMEFGVTHYTHWFHPLTGETAEKHDSFLDYAVGGGFIERFSGDLLAQQEPDASSFPSGGLRNTFEARGYTAWDPSSPAFIFGTTLCIPTIFISYTGEALDHKTPLLKALNALDKAATDVSQIFDKNVSKVHATLGWEQEYFLIDQALFDARPDLVIADRTLMGHAAAKDQQLEDHYFGAIPERVSQFMQEVEYEAWKLGIPVKTRHNEVAPNQYEFAPIFEEVNLAVDHNLLIMHVIRRVAKHHKFRVIFHEKPFAGVNGSGKHNNWSMATDTGVNLLAPGKNPKSNLQFLTFLVNVLKALYSYSDVLLASISTVSNQHRLGANEAPPAILSVFLGAQLSAMLDDIEQRVSSKKMTPEEKTAIKLNIGRIPEILLDNTDRNRTSPFAFTGNRFEFRAVGSSANCAAPMTVLNTIVANQLIEFKKEFDVLTEKGIKKDEAVFQIIKKYIIDSKPIRFEGDNYCDDWKEEAKKRGLANTPEVPKALDAWLKEDAISLFNKMGVLSEKEIEARTEVMLETYTKRLQIESRLLGDMAINHVIPVAVKYQNVLMDNLIKMKTLYGEAETKELSGSRFDLIRNLSVHVISIKGLVQEMIDARATANAEAVERKKAMLYNDKVVPYMEKIRLHVDALELTVDDEDWPLPKYREILFTR